MNKASSLLIAAALTVSILGCAKTAQRTPLVRPALSVHVDQASDLLHANRVLVVPVHAAPDADIGPAELELLSSEIAAAFRAGSDLEVVTMKSSGSSALRVEGTGGQSPEQAARQAREVDADSAAVTTVYRYVEREGSRVGAEQGAIVNFQIRLIRAADAREIWHASYFFKDEALTDNLFRMNERLKGPGSKGWRTAQEIAREGFQTAAADLTARRSAEFSAAR